MLDVCEETIDIDNFLNITNLQDLDNLENIINYGIHLTITKQLGPISPDQEIMYANQILVNYINGQKNAFTNLHGIRTIINSISDFIFNALMIKAAIARNAFNITCLHKKTFESNEDQVAKTITEQIADNNFDDILSWINSDNRVMPMLVENYLDISYQKDDALQKAYPYIIEEEPSSNKAFQNLNYLLQLDKKNKIKT